ncbi:MAG: V-type ATP synthase subunit I [bacterium]
MSVEKLKKIEIVALKRIKQELLEVLQHQGKVHISGITDDLPDTTAVIPAEGDVAESDDAGWLGQIHYAINYLNKFDPLPKGFLESLAEPPLTISRQGIQDLLSNFDLDATIQEAKELDRTAQALEAEKRELIVKIEEFSSWDTLDAPMKDIVEGTKYLDFYPLLIHTEQQEPFQRALESVCTGVHIEEIGDMPPFKAIFLMTFKTDREKVEAAMGVHDARHVSLPALDETPEEFVRHCRERLAAIDTEQASIVEQGEGLFEKIDTLKILSDHFQNQQLKREIQSRFAFTEQTVSISGWVRERDLDGLKQTLDQFKDAVDLDIIDPTPDETPPVALANNRFSSPFELVTKLYDLPHYRELDPTPVLAPFFFLFFGICLTDLGYGLVLAGIMYWGLKTFYLDKGKRQLLQLFLLCGVSTIICGALTGGWFGDIFNYLPAWLGFLRTMRDSITLLDPLKDPLTFLIIALGLGFVQVLTGIGVRMYKDLQAGDYYAALLQRLPWMTFLSSLILFMVIKAGSGHLIAKWTAIVSAGTICLCEGRSETNIFRRLGTGLLALYGTVGYYADMLSYCRLLALGLATAVIANVVNQMAILSRGIPYIGIVFMVLVLIGGHIFNLLINLLGAFVHTSRLQFVEFFTKFFEGGGKAFIPFERQNRYSYIE